MSSAYTIRAVVLRLMRSTTEFQSTVDMNSAMQAATFPTVHSVQANSTLYQSQDFGSGVTANAQDAPNVSGSQVQHRDAEALGTF